MYIKIYNIRGEKMVAACDREIIGLKFKEGDISVDVPRDFYGGRIADIETMSGAIKDATILNLMGNRVVDAAIRAGAIDENNVIKIGKVKHAQMIRI